jgi:thioredoxin 1
VALVFTDANFQSEVLDSQQPVLVDFSATWCGPCRQLSPIIEDLAREYSGRAKIGKVDIDDSQDVAAKLGIMSVPTVIFFKGGKPVDTAVGLNSKAYYQKKLDGLITAR